MSLGAMMAGTPVVSGTRVDMVSLGSWVVPGGVSSVRVYARAPGGIVQLTPPYTTNDGGGGGSAYAGGGGGGSAIIGVAFPVSVGETLTLAVGGGLAELTFSGSGQIARAYAGENSGNTDNRAGNGGGAEVNVSGTPTTVTGGSGGTWLNSGNGGDGSVATAGGGTLYGGGGGAKGARVTPSEGPFTGGSSSGFPGTAGVSPGYGGGGGGFSPGQQAVSSSALSVVPTNYVFDLYY